MLNSGCKMVLAMALGLMMSTGGASAMQSAEKTDSNKLIDGKTFSASDKVISEKVSYKNRYGIT